MHQLLNECLYLLSGSGPLKCHLLVIVLELQHASRSDGTLLHVLSLLMFISRVCKLGRRLLYCVYVVGIQYLNKALFTSTAECSATDQK